MVLSVLEIYGYPSPRLILEVSDQQQTDIYWVSSMNIPPVTLKKQEGQIAISYQNRGLHTLLKSFQKQIENFQWRHFPHALSHGRPRPTSSPPTPPGSRGWAALLSLISCRDFTAGTWTEKHLTLHFSLNTCIGCWIAESVLLFFSTRCLFNAIYIIQDPSAKFQGARTST